MAELAELLGVHNPQESMLRVTEVHIVVAGTPHSPKGRRGALYIFIELKNNSREVEDLVETRCRKVVMGFCVFRNMACFLSGGVCLVVLSWHVLECVEFVRCSCRGMSVACGLWRRAMVGRAIHITGDYSKCDQILLIQGTIGNRTYGTHKNLPGIYLPIFNNIELHT